MTTNCILSGSESIEISSTYIEGLLDFGVVIGQQGGFSFIFPFRFTFCRFGGHTKELLFCLKFGNLHRILLSLFIECFELGILSRSLIAEGLDHFSECHIVPAHLTCGSRVCIGRQMERTVRIEI